MDYLAETQREEDTILQTWLDCSTNKRANSGLNCSWHKVSAWKTTVNIHIISAYGISSNLHGADDHVTKLDTVIQMIFSYEDDDEVFQAFIAKAVIAAMEDVNKLLME